MDDNEDIHLGTKIISNIDILFRNDGAINEYDILPFMESKTNRNPVFVVEHKMAIEAWAARIMLCTAVNQLAGHKTKPGTVYTNEIANQLASITRAILLVVADHMTAWNVRKELVQQHHLSIHDDLNLSDLIIYKHRKTPETFMQRRWLLQKWLNDKPRCCSTTSNTVQQVCNCSTLSKRECFIHSDERHGAVRHELDICLQTADRYPNNYHAWSHRIWVVEKLACCLGDTVKEEMETSRRFVNSHVSDHSGFHYRQFLLNQLALIDADHEGNLYSHLTDELSLTSELNESFPGHEAVWYHRRYVLHQLVSQSLHSRPANSLPPAAICPDDVDLDLDSVAAKKTKYVATDHTGDCHPVLANELAVCRRLLDERRLAGLPWHASLIRRHIAWTERLATSASATRNSIA